MSNVGQANIFSDASEYNMLDFVIARATEKMQTVSIVQVKAVDTGALTVDVQVLVNLVTGANQSIPHGVISARPYYRAQGGTSGIILDPVVGDIGVMVFTSRDSSAVIATKGLANPGSQRRFSWSDGIYFGGILNAAPTQYLKFASGGVTLLSPTAATIDAPMTTVTAALAVAGASTLTGAVDAPGGITVGAPTGGAAAPGTINAVGLFVNGVAVSTGGGGGGGTVTSVGISTPGAGVVVSGGPITGAGTLTVDLSAAAYATLALAATALQTVSVTDSITGNGAGTALSLVNDSASPGASMVYGTDGSGTKGWQTAGGGPTAALPGTIPDLVMWVETDNILGTGGNIVTRIQEKTPWITGVAAANMSGTVTIDTTLLNSLPALKWPAAGAAGIYNLQPGFLLSGGATYFIVAKGSTISNQAIVGGGSGNLALYLTNGSAASLGLVDGAIAIIGTSSATWTAGTWFQANVTYDAGSGAYSFRQSQTAANSGVGTAGAGSSAQTELGADGGTAELNSASIAAVIVYNRVLTSPEILSVEAYLHSKWGV